MIKTCNVSKSRVDLSDGNRNACSFAGRPCEAVDQHIQDLESKVVLTLSEATSDRPVAKIKRFVPAKGSHDDVVELVLAGDPGISRKTAESASERRVCILT